MGQAAEEEFAGPPPDGTAGFLHVDMDAFYASVETLRRPELRGRPVVVGGSGRRGVVAAASYEARAFGVRSAMPSIRARRLCPQAVFLPGDIRLYAEVSQRVMDILRDFTPLVEPLSLDEAFCDVRGVARLSGPAPQLAGRVRARVLRNEGLTCSVGVAPSKFLAKLATEQAKPKATPEGPVFGSGVHVVEAGAELAFLHPLPVRAVFGVGPATDRRLAEIGVATVGELASLPESAATSLLGQATGLHLQKLAQGLDDRPVVTRRPARSIGSEETFARDLRTRAEVDAEAARLADAAARRMRTRGLAARTVTVKVRFGDFTTVTRSQTLDDPANGSRDIATAALRLLGRVDLSPGVRLVGVSASGLSPASVAGSRQLSFAWDGGDGTARSEEDARRHDAEQVLDAIRDRFGDASIGPAAQVKPDRPMRPGPGAARPWGPDPARRS